MALFILCYIILIKQLYNIFYNLFWASVYKFKNIFHKLNAYTCLFDCFSYWILDKVALWNSLIMKLFFSFYLLCLKQLFKFDDATFFTSNSAFKFEFSMNRFTNYIYIFKSTTLCNVQSFMS